jgi:predicted benzoate:H+ symporter BenE
MLASSTTERDPTFAGIRTAFQGNKYGLSEWAGAFGDLGTLIPFVVAYITVAKLDPAGILFAFGISKIAVGLFYKTPVPVQPMKAIGAAAIAQAGTMTSGMIYSSGIVTGLVWLLLGLTNLVGLVAKLAAKPVVRGIVLGLGLLFVTRGIEMMSTLLWLGAIAAVLTLFLFSREKIPAMFVLLILGAGVALWQEPELLGELSNTGLHLHLL